MATFHDLLLLLVLPFTVSPLRALRLKTRFVSKFRIRKLQEVTPSLTGLLELAVSSCEND